MRKSNKIVYALIPVLAVAMVWAFASCSDKGSGTAEAEPSVANSPVAQGLDDKLEARSIVRVGALKGPTGMGMVRLMDQNERNETKNIYEFDEMAGSPEEIVNKLVLGELDIAALPTNTAANLYRQTDGGLSILAVNTLGNLYVVQKPRGTAVIRPEGDEAEDAEEQADEEAGAQAADQDAAESAEDRGMVKELGDLSGRRLYASGEGATPQYVLEYILAQNGVEDVTVEFRSEHTELAGLMAAGKAELAMLPQPFVTSVLMQDDTMETVVDITAQWEKATGGAPLTTGCIVVRTAFLEENPKAVSKFLEEYGESTAFTGDSLEEAAQLIEKYEITSAAVAVQAVPACNIVCLTGEEMKAAVETYLGVLLEANPSSVGGALPDDDFYYIAR